jgi:hypothetical protein
MLVDSFGLGMLRNTKSLFALRPSEYELRGRDRCAELVDLFAQSPPRSREAQPGCCSR